jgi:hypothetical protein
MGEVWKARDTRLDRGVAVFSNQERVSQRKTRIGVRLENAEIGGAERGFSASSADKEQREDLAADYADKWPARKPNRVGEGIRRSLDKQVTSTRTTGTVATR